MQNVIGALVKKVEGILWQEESKLTLLNQRAFGGNCKILIILNIIQSPGLLKEMIRIL